MNPVDLIALAVIGISALLGLSRGLVREVLGFGSWVVAGYGAYRFGPMAMPMAEQAIGNPDIADSAAYVGVFVILLVALSLISNLVGRAVQFSPLGGLDRTLGLVFGGARGVALLIAAYIPAALMLPPEKWPPAALNARSIYWIYAGAVWAADHLPPAYRPRVAPPPEEKPATAAEWLHAIPEGRALGPVPERTN